MQNTGDIIFTKSEIVIVVFFKIPIVSRVKT